MSRRSKRLRVVDRIALLGAALAVLGFILQMDSVATALGISFIVVGVIAGLLGLVNMMAGGRGVPSDREGFGGHEKPNHGEPRYRRILGSALLLPVGFALLAVGVILHIDVLVRVIGMGSIILGAAFLLAATGLTAIRLMAGGGKGRRRG